MLTDGWLCSKLPNLHLVFNRMLWHKTAFVGWMQTSATSPGGQTEALREEIDRQDITLHHLQLQIDTLMREKKVNQKQYQEYYTTIARTSSQLLGLAGSYSDLRQRIIPILDLRQRFESVDEELQAQKQTTASIEKDIRNLQRRQDWMTMFSKRDRHLQLKHNVAATPKPASEEINPISSFEETAAALGKQISIHKRYVSDSIRAIENRQAVQQAVLDSYGDKLVHLSSLAVKPADPQTLAALEEQISFHKRHVTDTIRAVEKRQVMHQAVLDSYAAKLEHLSSLIEKWPEPPETCSSDEEIKALLEKKFKSVVTQSKNKFDIHEARITALEKDVYKPIQQTLPVEDRLENLEYDVENSVDQLKDLTKQTSDTIDSISVLHDRVDNLRLDMKNVVRKATDTTDPETVSSMSRDIEILHARIGNLKTLHNDSISNLSRELEEQVAKINAKIDADLNRVRSRWHHADKCRADRHNALDQSLKESLHTVSINYMGLKQHVDELKHGMIKLETGVADRLQLLIDTFLPDDEESPLEPSRARSNPSDRMRTSETVTLLSRILTSSIGLSEEMQHNTSDPAGAGLPDNQQQPTVGENTHADEGSASREDIDSSLLQIDTVADRVQKKVGYLTARYFALKDAFRTASFASRSSMPYEDSAQAGIDKLEESAGIGSETDGKRNAGFSATIAADLDVGQEESFEQESRSLPSADNNRRVTLYRADLTSAAAPLVSSPSPWTSSSQISLMSPTSNSTLWPDRVISPASGSVHPLDTPFSNDTSASRMETNALVTGGKHGTILHSSVTKEQPARSSINEQETFSLAEFERFKAGMERRLVILESDFRSHYASQTALITGISANHSAVSVNPHPTQPTPNVLSGYETAMRAVKTRMTGFEDLLSKTNSRIILLESGMTQLVDDTQALLQSRLKHISILQTATDIKVNDLQNSVRVLNWMHRGLERPPR
ncbi:hypothetical protein QFC24_002741 [Naganishia onofrii]|uniref:Uncharacterized protein n=1 Tax=Naganishia onofrii TaxID=1851511 RepID=A0ACC2XRD7_9TREE|nr:hypothetical protein QFC24_002741 [Naganishia onofrii]